MANLLVAYLPPMLAAALVALLGCQLAERLRQRRRPGRLVAITPCSGWVARFAVDATDTCGMARRPVAAWGLVRAGDGYTWVVGMVDWRVPGSPACGPELLACDEVAGFVAYDQELG